MALTGASRRSRLGWGGGGMVGACLIFALPLGGAGVAPAAATSGGGASHPTGAWSSASGAGSGGPDRSTAADSWVWRRGSGERQQQRLTFPLFQQQQQANEQMSTY